jgi:hypothetical protein
MLMRLESSKDKGNTSDGDSGKLPLRPLAWFQLPGLQGEERMFEILFILQERKKERRLF